MSYVNKKSSKTHWNFSSALEQKNVAINNDYHKARMHQCWSALELNFFMSKVSGITRQLILWWGFHYRQAALLLITPFSPLLSNHCLVQKNPPFCFWIALKHKKSRIHNNFYGHCRVINLLQIYIIKLTKKEFCIRSWAVIKSRQAKLCVME